MGNDFRPTQGEFRGDFSRDTFDPSQHFLRVLVQQGRVQLDADWNEQTAILLHYLQTLARDLIGEHGGPGDGFKIEKLPDATLNFSIGKGHYYVDGILCENAETLLYTAQKGFPFLDSPAVLDDGQKYLVYLDVWERHVTYLEDERGIKEGNIREVALGLHGPDTTTRSQLVWQVKVLSVDTTTWEVELKKVSGCERPRLRARAHVSELSTDPCTIQPDMRYRGSGNQLYRVEIHKGGEVGNDAGPTFKWSRENGSVVFPIDTVEGKTVTVAHLGRDDRFGLKVGDRVEIVDDDYVLQNRAVPLLQVDGVDRDLCQVTLHDAPQSTVGADPKKHPLLRRWDHHGDPRMYAGALQVKEGDEWLTLEDGVQIQFPKLGEGQDPYEYRTGDYWLVPARIATGDVEWLRDGDGDAVGLPPHGIDHHYAPLRLISVEKGTVSMAKGLRKVFNVPTPEEK